MKKIASLLVALMLALTVAACGGGTDTPAPETPATPGTETPAPETPVTGLTGSITVQAEGGWMPYYTAAVARFLANNPDATVEIKEVGSFDNLDVLDQTGSGNPDVPDVFAIPADRIYGLFNNEALAGMDAKAMAAQVGGFADYDGGLGGNFMIEGEYFAFPMNIETLILFGNTANAAAAGVDLASNLEFTELAGTDILIPAWNAWFGVALTNSAEIELLGHDADGNLYSDMTADWADLAPEKQAVVESLFNYWKEHADAGTPLWDSEAAWGFMDEQFTTGGLTSLRIEGPWSTGNLSNQAGNGEDLELLPIGSVTLNGNPLNHWKGGWGIAINSRTEADAEKMALAEAFIVELMNTDYAVDFFESTGKIMENVPADVYLASSLSDADKLVIENVLASFENAPARPLFTEWGQVWGTWENALLSWQSVRPANAEAAYREIKAAFDAMMLNF